MEMIPKLLLPTLLFLASCAEYHNEGKSMPCSGELKNGDRCRYPLDINMLDSECPKCGLEIDVEVLRGNN
jgi:hypothetical protein